MFEKRQSDLVDPYTAESGRPVQRSHCSSQRRRSIASVLIGVGIGCLCANQYVGNANVDNTQNNASECGLVDNRNDPELIWQRLAPSEKLMWLPCYEGSFQCAKFAVPLDYGNPLGPKASVALIKVPSKIPLGEEGHRGPILFNPGGPGSSGVDLIRRLGNSFQKVLGGDYDIIGFDPRGVGRTEPKILIFPERAEKDLWDLQSPPPVNSTPDALARRRAQSLVYSSLAEQRVQEAAQYVSTAIVSRDMLAISRAHGFDKLQYWGFSYGTILGATFAAMFPDNVGRLIIDGVADAPDYYKTQWAISLRDTDAALKWFTDACAEAGPNECALYEDSKEKVAERMDNLFAKLKTSPIAVPLSGNSTSATDYGIVDYGLVRQTVLLYLLSPYHSSFAKNDTITAAAKLSEVLAAAGAGNGLPAWNLWKDARPNFGCECSDAPKPVLLGDAQNAILCSDGDPVTDTLEELQKHYEGMAKYSSFADVWILRARCVGWTIRPKERFAGPFIGNTSFPLLVVHCSLSATSICTLKHVRDYFREGKVPEAGVICETEDTLFEMNKETQDLSKGKNDYGFADAVRELSNAFEVPRFPGV